MKGYGKDLDAWDEEDECYINDDYISVDGNSDGCNLQVLGENIW